MGKNHKIKWGNQLYWLGFVWMSFIENGELKMSCVTWDTNDDMVLMCLSLICSCLFLVNMVLSCIKRETWGWGGQHKGANVNKRHIKHHQEYIQSLMELHLPRTLDINSLASGNCPHSSHLTTKYKHIGNLKEFHFLQKSLP